MMTDGRSVVVFAAPVLEPGWCRPMTDTDTIDLTRMGRDELARALREWPMERWNDAVRRARVKTPGWRANLWRANLWRANLGGANLGRANLGGASLWRADLGGASLGGANLGRATIGDHELTGRTTILGECAGYPVLMFETEACHVLRAGCWTGTLDEAVERALEESDAELVRVEAEAVVAHGRALLAAWKAATDD